MKLIIQIPCFNEAESLPETVRHLPREIPGVDEVEFLVVDDGSSDETARAARAAGVRHVVRLPRHLGLASAFSAGLEACLRQGADVIVNTDADNQYRAEDIQRLLGPILAGRADMVVGDRQVATVPSFSPVKRRLQTLGSWVVGRASGLQTPDATSGFRALTRDAALRTLVLNEYSYTLETLIRAGARRAAVVWMPVRTNPPVRPSRLMRSTAEYVRRSGLTVLRAYAMYRPLRVFAGIGALLIPVGMIPCFRFLYLIAIGEGVGHVQSLILGAILIVVGFQVLLMGVLADLVGFNRMIIEDIFYRIRKLDVELSSLPAARTRQHKTHGGASRLADARAAAGNGSPVAGAVTDREGM